MIKKKTKKSKPKKKAKEKPLKEVKDQDKHLTRLYIETDLNGNEVAKRLGITRQAVCQRLGKPEVKNFVQEQINGSLARAKITRSRVYKRLSYLLDAKKVDSVLLDFVPDNAAIGKAVELSLKLYGDYGGDEDSKNDGVTAIQVNIKNAAMFMTKQEMESVARNSRE